MNLKKTVHIFLLCLGLLFLILVLLNDLFQARMINYGNTELFGLLFVSLYILSCLILINLDKYKFLRKFRLLFRKVYLIEIILILVLMGSLYGIANFFYGCSHCESTQEYAIGIYSSNSSEPFVFANATANNPVLTCNDVKDVPAAFVADPFLVYNNGSYYLFFEVMNKANCQGDIGMATSIDGFNWSYKKIVLDEPFQLSYPYVFKWNDTWYMIPETQEVKDIRLYRSNDFPYNWSLERKLLEGYDFSDSTIFNYNNTWWLFTQTSTRQSSMFDLLRHLIKGDELKENNVVLRLYYSDNLNGTWIEHPGSPVIEGDANITRPGGRVVTFNNRIVRYAQDDDPYYGNQVWAFEILEISKQLYKEKKVSDKPILKGFDSWNTRGMHQLSPYQINKTTWIAAVDGYP